MQAQAASVAEIWLWHIGSWKVAGRLQSHTLTVTQMEFSHDDRFLLSVSRDRQFSLFKVTKAGTELVLLDDVLTYVCRSILGRRKGILC